MIVTIVRPNGDFTDLPATAAPATGGGSKVTVKFPMDWVPGLIRDVIFSGTAARVGFAPVHVEPGDTLTLLVGEQHIVISPW